MGRLLFGNPKETPAPPVKLMRLNRYKNYEHPTLRLSGWEILTPPRGPSWAEKEGLLPPEEQAWNERIREGAVGEIRAYWWNAKQWLFQPFNNSLIRLDIMRNFDRYSGRLHLFGYELWNLPKRPRTRRVSKKELRQWFRSKRTYH